MRNLLLGTTLLVASTTLALGQAPTAQAPAPAAPATLANDLRPTFVAQAATDRVTSKLIGLTIQNGANETIGEIADIVLDESSTIKAWIVGVGGFLGIGTKYVAIDPSALKLTRVDDKTMKASIETTKDQIRAAPEYIYLGAAKPNEAKPAASDVKPAAGDGKPVTTDAKPAAADMPATTETKPN
ncbi:photosystem reaction center subunit H [Methylobacterium sp. Leaf399]|uniref:PRC-barrel domain-containing protein n=1 Tax=Methylobacterium sp. Leaf399 TaxID=1736364 RepID=UPI0006F28886|nr:PRC-barrel domain-containing protein [Methylobacterium sp. Leaf399]KQT09938.1 photosystem reaction center subunit H [Methylobacterium sp. Leaf399]